MQIIRIVLGYIKILISNIVDLFSVFIFKKQKQKKSPDKLNILIFNWRDLSHVWAGGAEVYIQELASRWVKDGNSVTIFCGNDAKSPRNEIIDGIQIVRRGGFYTVYAWAALYYILKFKRQYDVIVDSENGVPFFSPIFSTKPVVLLAHHVNQQIFLDHLPFPRAQLARFIEAKVMPFLYRNAPFVTVSESSKQELVKTHIAHENQIQIVNPGIEAPIVSHRKTAHPTVIYFGRLKPYKNIDIAIKAFAKILPKFPKAELYIAGEGDSMDSLVRVAKKLKIGKNITFFGKVSEERKWKLLAQSWVAIQPSQVEGWGITVIEANAVGTPVIASNVNGLRDSIVNGKTGILVALRNVSETATALSKVLENKKLRTELSTHALEWSKKFSWNGSAQRFYAILKEITSDSNARRIVPRISLNRMKG